MDNDTVLLAMYQRLKDEYAGREAHGLIIKFWPVRLQGIVRVPGEFVLRPDIGVAAIYLRRSNTEPRSVFKEFCTLTHELGHWCSWRDGTRSPEYEAALAAGLATMATRPEAERRLILDEEIRAWRHGFSMAQEVEFTDAERYSDEMLRGLSFYCEQLKLDPKCLPTMDSLLDYQE